MGMFSVFDIAGSAMNAQMLRLNLTASNLANAQSASSSTGETYRARHAVFAAMLDQGLAGEGGVGVRVAGVVSDAAPPRREYNPGHPLADADGYVFLPNVNVVEEMANMISASRSYQTNVEVMNTAKQLMLRTLRLGE